MNCLVDKNICGKKVLVRVDFNVPLNANFQIIDDNRIRCALPTIKQLISLKAKIILISHLGRPEKKEIKFSLSHIVGRLSKLLSKKIYFSSSCVGKEAFNAVKNLKNGDVLMLENLRYHKEEKMGDQNFSKKLSSLADIYINDAFGTAHREHASTSVIAGYFPKNKYLGLLFKKELSSLKKVFDCSEKPFTAIIGGAKISSKIDVIDSLIDKVDNLIIGGGMSYTFAKAKGGKIGMSLLEDDKVKLAQIIIKKCREKDVNLLLPIDSVNSDKFSNDSIVSESDILKIKDNEIGMDIGPKSISLFSNTIQKSKTIIWNGPMGVFEMSNFENGTKEIALAVCKATKDGAFSLVGGGDSTSAIKKYNLQNSISYISTGGGAMLAFLEGKELSAVKAICQ